MKHKTDQASASPYTPTSSKTWITALAVIALVGVLAPRTLAFLPAVIGLLGYLSLYVQNRTWPRLHRRTSYAILAVSGLILISMIWTFNREMTWERFYKTTPIFLGYIFMLSWLKPLSLDYLRLFRPVLRNMMIIAGLFILVEILTNGVLTARFHDMSRFGGVSFMNTSVNVFLFCTLPVFYTKTFKKLDYILAALLGLVTLLSDSQSTQLALLVFPIMYWIVPLKQPWIWRSAMTLIAILFIGAPFLSSLAFSHLAENVSTNSWMAKAYAADRLEIWDAVARRALEKPFWGHGIEITRMTNDLDLKNLYFPDPKALHPHNFVLQIWIEFGLFGALICTGLLLVIIRKIWKTFVMNEKAGRFYLSVFTALLIVAATTYGIWQGWWIGFFCWILGATYVSVKAQNEEGKPQAAIK